MDGQIRRLDAQPVTLQNYRPKPTSLLREATRAPAATLPRKLPDLVVTLGGVPVADQAAGVRAFKAACLRPESAGALAAEFRTAERDAK